MQAGNWPTTPATVTNVVRVRYDPGDPQQSCLSYGVYRSIQIGLAFSATWLGFFVGFTLLWWMFTLPDTSLLHNLSVNGSRAVRRAARLHSVFRQR
ncbi:hypothetical protein [Blastopirellula retiformator]|uniref:Uncharacterized protein n=1 Tax=Blastopirellula retiformator TaxID=2527970 RepID=A0A5C5USQ8_9BACT|nr:hypothetical protein [Blastopirellula retiformator]TWT29414.1 hypothetical protein Enr8_49300 [Blastopirellula retiformator]